MFVKMLMCGSKEAHRQRKLLTSKTTTSGSPNPASILSTQARPRLRPICGEYSVFFTGNVVAKRCGGRFSV